MAPSYGFQDFGNTQPPCITAGGTSWRCYSIASRRCEGPAASAAARLAVGSAALYRSDRDRHITAMAILKIARMGHPVLLQPAAPVDDPTSPEIRRLIADMIETLVDADGAGLAAPQVHVGKQVVIFHVPAARAEDEESQPLTVLINPRWERLTDETALGWEACLSVPGLGGQVPRYTHIRYFGITPEGTAVEREARGFHARVVQHEFDHLEGILYPMRMTDLRLLGFVDELRRVSLPEEAEEELKEAAHG